MTKCPHLGVNELDQGRHAQPWRRKQKATQTVRMNPTPSSICLHHLSFKTHSAIFVSCGSVQSPQEPLVDFTDCVCVLVLGEGFELFSALVLYPPVKSMPLYFFCCCLFVLSIFLI